VQTHYKLGDILANAITHGVGAILAVVGAVYLIAASTRGSVRLVVSCSVFASTLVLVYLCSTLYHSLVRTRARHVFHVLDHSSIYMLIAGTYTPFTLISLHGPLGWTIFGVEWALAVAGVVFKSFAVDRFAVASALVYLFQSGWIGVYAGHRFLCLRPAALFPCHLAYIRPGRQRVPLLRHPFLRGSGARVTWVVAEPSIQGKPFRSHDSLFGKIWLQYA
jgi:channel protein (hemolysin III family)